MKNKKVKDETTVRTSAIEAIIVLLVCLIAFFGLVYIKLAPYIGESISDSQPKKEEVETQDIFSEDVKVIHLDEEGNIINDGTEVEDKELNEAPSESGNDETKDPSEE